MEVEAGERHHGGACMRETEYQKKQGTRTDLGENRSVRDLGQDPFGFHGSLTACCVDTAKSFKRQSEPK
jgi:hypothetical protein